jgi:hypothetical protein
LQRALSALGEEVDRPRLAGTAVRLSVRASAAEGGAAAKSLGKSHLGVALGVTLDAT